MIKVKLLFSVPEVIEIFRNAGLTVKMHDFPEKFGDTVENIPVYAVMDPYTGEFVKLEDAFLQYVNNKRNEILNGSDRMEIYNIFRR